MRIEHTLISLVALLLGVLLLSLGLALLFPLTQEQIAFFLEENLLALGVLFVTFSLILLISFTHLFGRRYLLLKMGKVAVQDKVVCTLIESALGEVFPLRDVTCDALFHRKQLEILLHLPYIPLEERESVLHEIEAKLESRLASDLGIKEEFIVNVSFRERGS